MCSVTASNMHYIFFFQLSYLSVECISFGDVPLYAVSHRIFFLTNSSKDHIISFRWLLEGSALEQVQMLLKHRQPILFESKASVIFESIFIACTAGPASSNDG